MLAADAFARDTGTGRLEFLYSIGAPASRLFAARAAVLLATTLLFPAALYFLETLRLLFFNDGDYSKNWTRGELTLLAARPRESFLLYLVPSVALFLFLSSISTRTRTAVAAGIVMMAAIVAGDLITMRDAEAIERRDFTAAGWTLLMIPASLLLGAVAVWVRRFEPERSRARIALLSGAVGLVILRFFIIYESGKTAAPEKCTISAVAISADQTKIAVESHAAWHPAGWMLSVGNAVGRPLNDKDYYYGTRVAVSARAGRAKSITNNPAAIERSQDSPAWMNNKQLRVRSIDPSEALETGDPEMKPYLFDSERGRFSPAPNLFLTNADSARLQQFWTMEIVNSAKAGGGEFVAKRWRSEAEPSAENESGEMELFHFKNGSKLIIQGRSELYIVDRDGRQERLWPAARAAAATEY